MIPIVTTDTLPGYVIVRVIENFIVAYTTSGSFYAATDEIYSVLRGMAKANGATAIIGLRISPQFIDNYVMITAYGTPVVVEPQLNQELMLAGG